MKHNIRQAAQAWVKENGFANTKRKSTSSTIMEALAITIFLSVLLAAFFVVLFLGSRHRRGLDSEQEALMPLEDDLPPVRRGPPPTTNRAGRHGT